MKKLSRWARLIAGVRTVAAAAVRSRLTTHTATGVHACLLAPVLTIARRRRWVDGGQPRPPISSRPHGDYMTVAVSWFLSAGRRWPTTKSGGGVLKATTRPMSGMETWHALRFLPFRSWSAKRRPCSLKRKRQERREPTACIHCTHVSQFVVRPSAHPFDRSNARTGATLRKKITQVMMMMMRQRLVMAYPGFRNLPRHRLRFAAVVVERRRLPTFSLSLASSSS